MPPNDPLATLPPHLRRQRRVKRRSTGATGIESLGRALGSGAAAAAGAVGAVSFGPTPPQFLEAAGGAGAGVSPSSFDALARAGLLRADGPTLAVGDDGAPVKALQAFLADQGCLAPDLCTGYFGAKTQEALTAWQSSQGISPATGLCGAQTRSALSKAVQAVAAPQAQAEAVATPAPAAAARQDAPASATSGWLDLPDYGEQYATEDEDEFALGEHGVDTLISHECARGESLASIAREYMVSVQRIVQVNPHIRDVRSVPEGTILRIPDEQDSHSFYGSNSLFVITPVTDDKPVVAASEAGELAPAASKVAAAGGGGGGAAFSSAISHSLQALVLGRPPVPGPSTMEANPLLVLPVMALSFGLAALAAKTRARRLAGGAVSAAAKGKAEKPSAAGGKARPGPARAGASSLRDADREAPSQMGRARDRLRSSVEIEIPGSGGGELFSQSMGGQGTPLPPSTQPQSPLRRSRTDVASPAPGRTPVRMTAVGGEIRTNHSRREHSPRRQGYDRSPGPEH